MRAALATRPLITLNKIDLNRYRPSLLQEWKPPRSLRQVWSPRTCASDIQGCWSTRFYLALLAHRFEAAAQDVSLRSLSVLANPAPCNCNVVSRIHCRVKLYCHSPRIRRHRAVLFSRRPARAASNVGRALTSKVIASCGRSRAPRPQARPSNVTHDDLRSVADV